MPGLRDSVDIFGVGAPANAAEGSTLMMSMGCVSTLSESVILGDGIFPEQRDGKDQVHMLVRLWPVNLRNLCIYRWR